MVGEASLFVTLLKGGVAFRCQGSAPVFSVLLLTLFLIWAILCLSVANSHIVTPWQHLKAEKLISTVGRKLPLLFLFRSCSHLAHAYGYPTPPSVSPIRYPYDEGLVFVGV